MESLKKKKTSWIYTCVGDWVPRVGQFPGLVLWATCCRHLSGSVQCCLDTPAIMLFRGSLCYWCHQSHLLMSRNARHARQQSPEWLSKFLQGRLQSFRVSSPRFPTPLQPHKGLCPLKGARLIERGCGVPQMQGLGEEWVKASVIWLWWWSPEWAIFLMCKGPVLSCCPNGQPGQMSHICSIHGRVEGSSGWKPSEEGQKRTENEGDQLKSFKVRKTCLLPAGDIWETIQFFCALELFSSGCKFIPLGCQLTAMAPGLSDINFMTLFCKVLCTVNMKI